MDAEVDALLRPLDGGTEVAVTGWREIKNVQQQAFTAASEYYAGESRKIKEDYLSSPLRSFLYFLLLVMVVWTWFTYSIGIWHPIKEWLLRR